MDINELIRLLEAIKELEEGTKATVAKGKTVAKKTKTVAKKTKRKASAYNLYMKKKLAQLKKKHPRTPHQTLFKKAAKAWKTSPERKRSMK